MWRVLIQNHTWERSLWEGTDASMALRLAREGGHMFKIKDCTVVAQVSTEEDVWTTVTV
jgi:hypothetical protein